MLQTLPCRISHLNPQGVLVTFFFSQYGHLKKILQIFAFILQNFKLIVPNKSLLQPVFNKSCVKLTDHMLGILRSVVALSVTCSLTVQRYCREKIFNEKISQLGARGGTGFFFRH